MLGTLVLIIFLAWGATFRCVSTGLGYWLVSAGLAGFVVLLTVLQLMVRGLMAALAVMEERSQLTPSFAIIERQQAETLIREANEQQHAIFESAMIGIAFTRERVFQKCNHRLHELLGYPQDELIGRTTRCLYPDEDSYREASRAYADLERGETHQRVQKLQRKDGTLFWCHMNGSKGRLYRTSSRARSARCCFSAI